jgi:hypothetical protein
MTMGEIRSGFGPSFADVRAANRFITWSIAVHIALVLGIGFGSRFWSASRENKPVMTITLGGTQGVRSTGTNALAGSAVEQAVPPPKRPEPVKMATPEPPAPVATRTRAQAAKPQPEARSRAIAATRPPTTGAQVREGTSAVDTGVKSTASGLSFGGGGFGGERNLADFCCPAYLDDLLGRIDAAWHKAPGERGGTTTLRFVIRRDGKIDLANVQTEKSSGDGILDRRARAALIDANPLLLPLPREYTEPTLILHLDFPYGSR